MADDTLLDEYMKLSQRYIVSGRLDEGEIDYKTDIGRHLEKTRQAVLRGDPNWPALVEGAFKNNLVRWATSKALQTWIEDKQGDALDAMRALWAKGDTPINDRIIFDRIRAFVPRVQPPDLRPHASYHNNFNGTGTRLRLIAVLLMAFDPLQYPPFSATAFEKAYEVTGQDAPPKGADEATMYEYALAFLDKLVSRAAGGRPVNRLEAQSIVWTYSWAENEIRKARKENPDYSLQELAEKTELPLDFLEGVEKMLEGKPPIPNSGPGLILPAPEMPSLQKLANELMFDVEFLERVEKLLEDKRQVIFQGPPGTGKTYTAKKLAACLAGSEERVRLVQFHPSYAYEDFVQGYRPKLIDGQPGFELKDGPLLDMAKMAEQDPEQKHFLVIDEINRGNLAKVFGEMYFLLEYRDEEMRLQYSESGETFAMPPNLYIIGTMNTADRSIALVDLALRRRFYFVVFHPNEWPVEGLLHRWLDADNPGMAWAADIVDRANELLADRDAAIGPSYLMKEGLDEEKARMIWEHNVLPYVEEHLYGQTDGLAQFDFDSLRGRSDSGGELDEPGENGEDEESAAGSDDA